MNYEYRVREGNEFGEVIVNFYNLGFWNLLVIVNRIFVYGWLYLIDVWVVDVVGNVGEIFISYLVIVDMILLRGFYCKEIIEEYVNISV